MKAYLCALGGFSLLAASAAAQCLPTFSNVAAAPSGGDYGSVARDFNGDGRLDLASVSFTGHDIGVVFGYLPSPPGTAFTPAGRYPVGTSPRAIETGDFNGDGLHDLAVANGSAPNVTVLFGAPNGTFTFQNNYYSGQTQAQCMAVRDLTGDNVLDIVVAVSGNLAVLRGNANGTFQLPVMTTLGHSSLGLDLADFNGDGLLDAVVSNYEGNTVSVRPGLPGGASFGPPMSQTTNFGPWGVTAADFNEDGRPDIAAALYVNHRVAIMLTNPDGSPGAPTLLVPQSRPYDVIAADFTDDGHLDLAVTNWNSSSVSVFRGHGDGAFDAPVHTAVGANPHHLLVADFNFDGLPDLGVTNEGPDTVSILLKTPCPCDQDFNCDGNSDQDDVACIINVVAGNPGCECQDPDFNRDGNVDQDDVGALINVVAGGPCP